MVCEQFRLDETSARLAWIGRTTGPQLRGPVAAMKLTGLSFPAVRGAAEQPHTPTTCGPDRARQVIQGRSILGPAGLLLYPSTSLLLATRLPTCYTALNHGRSAKPARSLLTELFLPLAPGFTLTSIATCHTGPRKLDICLYIGRNSASARRSRNVTERAARDLHYHPETGGTRDGYRVKRTDRRCRCPNPHRPGLSSRGTPQPGDAPGVHRPRRAPS